MWHIVCAYSFELGLSLALRFEIGSSEIYGALQHMIAIIIIESAIPFSLSINIICDVIRSPSSHALFARCMGWIGSIEKMSFFAGL